MATATINNMNVGQTQRVHVQAFAQDNANNPSQIVDTTTPLVVASLNTAVLQAQVDPSDNRAIIITAVGAGTASVQLNESPVLPAANVLTLSCTVATPPPDNRRIDFVSADAPV
jgi:hypothetical protein